MNMLTLLAWFVLELTTELDTTFDGFYYYPINTKSKEEESFLLLPA